MNLLPELEKSGFDLVETNWKEHFLRRKMIKHAEIVYEGLNQLYIYSINSQTNQIFLLYYI